MELSIVLVILGLLTGGILGGQELIRAAELRAITTEYDKFQTATNIFKQRFFALPGDFGKAPQFWGPADDCTGWTGDLSTDGSTCGGNDNGLMIADGGDTVREPLWYWQHLMNAGLINGEYTAHPTDADASFPKSKFGTAQWMVGYGTFEADESAAGGFVGKNSNVYIFANISAGMPVISPTNAWNIDTKIDDGKPALGRVQGVYSTGTASSPDCTIKPDGSAAARTDLDAEYKLSEDGKTCWLLFTNAF